MVVLKIKCKTCNRELSSGELKNRSKECNCCRAKRKYVKEFIKACDEFKQITGYDEILEKRERARK